MQFSGRLPWFDTQYLKKKNSDNDNSFTGTGFLPNIRSCVSRESLRYCMATPSNQRRTRGLEWTTKNLPNKSQQVLPESIRYDHLTQSKWPQT